jgi:hypothetical protein
MLANLFFEVFYLHKQGKKCMELNEIWFGTLGIIYEK